MLEYSGNGPMIELVLIQYIKNLAFCSFRILYIGVLGPQFSQHEVESRTIRMRWWAGWRSEVVSCVGWIMDGPLHGHWLKSWTWGYMWVIVGIWGIYIVGTSRYIEVHRGTLGTWGYIYGYIYGGSTLWVHRGTSWYVGVAVGSILWIHVGTLECRYMVRRLHGHWLNSRARIHLSSPHILLLVTKRSSRFKNTSCKRTKSCFGIQSIHPGAGKYCLDQQDGEWNATLFWVPCFF